MNLPVPDNYIDIHNHGAIAIENVFTVENLIASEERTPDETPGLTYSIGIHPWYLTPENHKELIKKVIIFSKHANVIALGEAGFDRIKGPEINLQRDIFEKQIIISEEIKKPLYIHCVRAWDELLAVRKKMKTKMPWLVHGFRGKAELAEQLISRGMYISLWFDFAIRPVSTPLIKTLPPDKFFLETDGGDVSIVKLYEKVAVDLEMSIQQLKHLFFSNFINFFGT